MSGEPALRVLRDIWHAREQTSADLDELFGHAKTCKAMRHVGFHGGADHPVDDDVRAAWRARLERDGKLRPHATSVRDLVLGQENR
jgi:hypothetical protein